MSVDFTVILQSGALGILVFVLAGVGYGIRLWATQSKTLTEQVLGVVADNSKVITQNTAAIDAVHQSLEGVRNDMRVLSMQIASQPCQAEELAKKMVEGREVASK